MHYLSINYFILVFHGCSCLILGDCSCQWYFGEYCCSFLWPMTLFSFMIHLLRLWGRFFASFYIEVARYFAKTKYTDKEISMNTFVHTPAHNTGMHTHSHSAYCLISLFPLCQRKNIKSPVDIQSKRNYVEAL